MTTNAVGLIALAFVLGPLSLAGAHKSETNPGVSKDTHDTPELEVRTESSPPRVGTRQRDPIWRYGESPFTDRWGHPFNRGLTHLPTAITPANPGGIGTPKETDDSDHKEATTPENAVYIFTGITSTLPPTTGRSDLCTSCLCTNDKKRVFCKASYRSPDSKILALNQSILPKNAEILAVDGYEQVKVEPGTFSGVGSLLKTITFQNIAQLMLEPESFYFQPEAIKNKEVAIFLNDCKIPTLPTNCFTQNVTSHHENKFIFEREKTRYLSIHIKRCHIHRIESEAVWRARLMVLNVTNTKIEFIAKGAIDVDVAELAKFKSNQLPSLPAKAICLHAKSTVFSENNIQQISNQSIAIETQGLVVFRENTIETLTAGGLTGIQPQRTDYGASITLDGNLLMKVEPSSLALDPAWPRDKVSLLNNTFNLPCECNLTLTLRSLLGPAPRLTREQEDDFVGRSRCHDPVSGGALTLKMFRAIDCRPFPIEIVSSVGAALILLVVTITVCVVCSLRVQRVKDEVDMLGDCASRSFSTLNRPYILSMPPTLGGGRDSLSSTTSETNPGGPGVGPEGVPASPLALLGPWAMAVPELKTYKEDQTPAFTEEAAPIRTPRDTLLGRLHPAGKAMRASNPLN